MAIHRNLRKEGALQGILEEQRGAERRKLPVGDQISVRDEVRQGKVSADPAIGELIVTQVELPKTPSLGHGIGEASKPVLTGIEVPEAGEAADSRREHRQLTPFQVKVAKVVEAQQAVVHSETRDAQCEDGNCLLYTSPSPRDLSTSRMPSSA